MEVRPGFRPRARLQRLFQLWRLYAYLDITVLLRDARTFFSWMISDTILNCAAITGTLLLAAKFDGIGKWSLWQVVFMLGYAMTATTLLDSFFGYNVSHISRRIGRGQLDHILAQPQPIGMALLTEGFIPFSGGVTVLPGLGMMAIALAKMGAMPTAAWLFWLVLNLGASCVVILSYAFLWGSVAFWAPRAAEEICTPIHAMFSQLKGYPLDRIGFALTTGLLTVLPIGFTAWYPCRSLLGMDPSLRGKIVTPLVALAFAMTAVVVFRRGLRHYYATGSQRYLDYGHRR